MQELGVRVEVRHALEHGARLEDEAARLWKGGRRGSALLAQLPLALLQCTEPSCDKKDSHREGDPGEVHARAELADEREEHCMPRRAKGGSASVSTAERAALIAAQGRAPLGSSEQLVRTTLCPAREGSAGARVPIESAPPDPPPSEGAACCERLYSAPQTSRATLECIGSRGKRFLRAAQSVTQRRRPASGRRVQDERGRAREREGSLFLGSSSSCSTSSADAPSGILSSAPGCMGVPEALAVLDDDEGDAAPWPPPTADDAFATKLLSPMARACV